MEFNKLTYLIQDHTKHYLSDLNIATENITNLSTPGYKVQRNNAQHQTVRHFKAGQLVVTGNKQDIALEGLGFFQLKDAEGNTYLKRNLYLETDKDGKLMSNGKYIEPAQTIDPKFSKLEIEPNGEIIGINPSDSTKIPLGHLNVIHYPSPQNLNYDGEFYTPTESAGKSQPLSTGSTYQSKVRQGAQELSNVDMPSEFARFSQINQQMRTLTSLMQLINSSRRQYIQTLSQMSN